MADTPGDSLRPLWNPLSGKPNNPLTQTTRDTTFVTWLVAQHNETEEIVYLKWVRWRVAYDAGYVVTTSDASTSQNAWTFQIIDQGEGIGPVTPSFTDFTETETYHTIP